MTAREANEFQTAVLRADPDLPMSRLDMFLASVWVFLIELAATIQKAFGF